MNYISKIEREVLPSRRRDAERDRLQRVGTMKCSRCGLDTTEWKSKPAQCPRCDTKLREDPPLPPQVAIAYNLGSHPRAEDVTEAMIRAIKKKDGNDAK